MKADLTANLLPNAPTLNLNNKHNTPPENQTMLYDAKHLNIQKRKRRITSIVSGTKKVLCSLGLLICFSCLVLPSCKPPEETPKKPRADHPGLDPARPDPHAALPPEKVRNNLLDGSIPAIRYWVEENLNNAEVARWGLVKKIDEGFRVRCTILSIDENGEMMESDKIFYLDKEGVITKVIE